MTRSRPVTFLTSLALVALNGLTVAACGGGATRAGLRSDRAFCAGDAAGRALPAA